MLWRALHPGPLPEGEGIKTWIPSAEGKIGSQALPGNNWMRSALRMALASHDNVHRVGVLVSLRRAVLGFQPHEIAGVMEIRIHQLKMLIIAHRPPNSHGFGGKH